MRGVAFSCMALWLAVSAGAAVLHIGDAAPPVSVSTWVRGAPVDPATDTTKKIYVVVFWGAEAPGSEETMAHLSGLDAQYKKGVVVVAISNERLETVRPFVDKTKAGGTVAVDRTDTTTKAWMEDAPGVPHAFIVQAKRILWAGPPSAALDETLARVVAGDWNLEKAREAEGLMAKLAGIDDPAKGLPFVDDLLELDPQNHQYHEMKIDLLTQKGDLDGARKAREELIRAMPRTAENLNALAWMFATHEDIRQRDLSQAYRLSRQAVGLSGGKNPAMLDTLARVYFELGMLDKAVETEQQALQLAPDENMKADIGAALDYFQSAQAVRREVENER